MNQDAYNVSLAYKFNIIAAPKQEYSYPQLEKEVNNIKLIIEPGNISSSEIVLILGEAGTGKTTFLKLIGGYEKADNNEILNFYVSVKRQNLITPHKICVQRLLEKRIPSFLASQVFLDEVIKTLNIDKFLTVPVIKLTNNQRQLLSICLTLGSNADIYLFDEPSLYLDLKQKITVATLIKRFIQQSKKAAFVVDSDLIFGSLIASKVILTEKDNSVIVFKGYQDVSEALKKWLNRSEFSIKYFN